jgi:hypothetical protein
MKKLLWCAACCVVALPLAFAGMASAKELREIKVCGPSACRVITDAPTMMQIASGGSQTFVPAPASEYYTVSYTVDEGGHAVSWENYYIPQSRKLRGEGENGFALWTRVNDAVASALASVTAGLVAFPTPALTGARVGGKAVLAGPGTYLDLYRLGTPFYGAAGGGGRMRIALQSATPSPWTDGRNRLLYLPARRLLWRDGQVVRLPKALANRLMRRVGLG